MLLSITLLEFSVLCLAVFGALLAWTPAPDLADPALYAALLARGLSLFLCFAVAFALHDLYAARVVGTFEAFVARLPHALSAAAVLLALSYAVWPRSRLPMEALVSGLLAAPGVMLPLRALAHGVAHSHPFTQRMLLLGTSPFAARLLREIEASPRGRCLVVGVCGDQEAYLASAFHCPFLGPLDELPRIVAQVRPDRVVVAMRERRGRMPVRELAELKLRGTVVEDGMDLYERLTGRLPLEWLTTSGVIFHRGFRRPRLYHAVARSLSLTLSVAALLALAPLFPLIALLIKLDSRGPVFFVQRRVGLRGEPFDMIKFRTMHPSAREVSVWVRDNGSRVTRLGRWLRRFRVDEVPQLVNIIRGDMNLVGPRPHPFSNHGLYLERIPHYWLRCLARPGITGWAQVRFGYANGLDEEIEKMSYDLYYIKHASPWLDLRILLGTAKLVLLGRESGTSATHPVAAREGQSGQGGEQAA